MMIGLDNFYLLINKMINKIVHFVFILIIFV